MQSDDLKMIMNLEKTITTDHEATLGPQHGRENSGLGLLESAFEGQHAPIATDLATIIVVNFNTREYTLACLRSLELHEPNSQVIVVDNASTDGSVEAIAEEFPDVTLLPLCKNIGFGRANMVGMQSAEHDIIVLFNSDAEVTDRSLSLCIRELTSRPELGAVTPRLRGADGIEQNARHAVPEFSNTLRRAMWIEPVAAKDADFWIPGTCLLLKRQAVETAGGLFNPLLFMYWEDADLCARLKQAGYEVAVVENAEVLHHGGASGGGPDCTGKPGLHAWYTYGRHVWFATHRPRWEAACLWLLEFVDSFRCMGRSSVRSDRRHEFRYGLTLLGTLLRYTLGLAPTFAISDTHGRRDDELVIQRESLNNAVWATDLQNVGAVVIGRNEGSRLRRCLMSMSTSNIPVVYVDSGSTDGSQELAKYLGVTLVELDMSHPFTAARARNEGLKELLELYPQLEFVQFVDGDCEVTNGWLSAARTMLAEDPSCGIVCGTLRERHPEKSIYNRLCQLEWRRPAGQIKSSGGIFMGRTAALQSVGGFNTSLIAGEEPEMCLRLRQTGWHIQGSPELMAQHDAAMTRFGQWWKRSVRSGYSYAEAFAMHGSTDERFRLKEVRSILFWGLLAPVGAVLLAWPSMGASLLLLAAGYLRLYSKIRDDRNQDRPEDARLYARFVVLGKFAQTQGVAKYWLNRIFHRKSRVIEYK